MSQLTTHILDTTRGKPAAGVSITLYRQQAQSWTTLATGTTNSDGRISDLLPKDEVLPSGTYKLKFLTQEYFDQQGVVTFYPFVEIVFAITTSEHYHVPLLLNPFGYSTYRGS
ncbi:hydroxyisourate hydrolase [Hymenobacter taeanensis]|uniref:5-hydroxyisourate hydrolase n=1 Tax=Hymenobacter taeanensis TaxID=2735321 RepID=A0A6M6BLK2_9BACT|nr:MULTISPECIES: hydroxyisourate hydrolase [Hymenobacter]QJX48333.1 hydroxyisourate hydrolase [Hymenobacter taeanensis]UOQ82177.1 hydroxyisourate hydrolase [Hymenobacter sp. 5414T-23]